MSESPTDRRTKMAKLDQSIRKENLAFESTKPVSRSRKQYFFNNKNTLPVNNLSTDVPFTEPLVPGNLTHNKARPPSAVLASGNGILSRKDPNIQSSNRAAQEFQLNIRTPNNKKQKRSTRTPKDSSSDPATPQEHHLYSHHHNHHPSSDDNIFWAVTPSVHKKTPNDITVANAYSQEPKSVPSSPLKEEVPPIQLIDPKLKNLLEKYNSTFEESTPNPYLSRSSSDPNALGGDTHPRGNSIIATKQTLSESMAQSFAKSRTKRKLSGVHHFKNSSGIAMHSSTNNSPTLTPANNNPDLTRKSVSQLLMQIGNSLSNITTTNDKPLSTPHTPVSPTAAAAAAIQKDNILDDLSMISALPDKPTDSKMGNMQSTPPIRNDLGLNREIKVQDPFIDESEVNLQANSKAKSVILDHSAANDTTTSDSEDTFSDDGDEVLQMIRSQKLNNESSMKTIVPVENTEDDQDDTFSDNGEEVLEIIKSQRLKEQVQIFKKPLHEDVMSEDSFSDDDDEELIELLNNRTKSQAKKMSLNNIDNVTQKLEEANIETDSVLQPIFDESINLAKACIRREECHRLQIKVIIKSNFKRNNQLKEQLILKCTTENDMSKNVVVRDQWAELNFEINDVIHIITDLGNKNFQLVDKDQNLLIWNPDVLLSATLVSESVNCKRKGVISTRFQSPGESSTPLILGSIVHSLFQECLITNTVTDEFINEFIEQQLDQSTIDLLSIGIDRNEMKNMIMEHVSYIKDWIDTYIPLPSSTEPSSNFKLRTPYKATNVLDVEENIWSPMFGLRGLIDVVIEARVNNGSRYVVPMEIKTGREYITNRAQVSLYTLLVKQRYGVESESMSLVYTKLKQSYFEALKGNDLKMLVNIRNHISQYMKYDVTELPPLKQQASCERCFSVTPCMVLNKLVEDGEAIDSGLEIEMYENITDQADNRKYKDFYKYWDDLITKEEGLVNSFKRDLWRLSSSERESNGGKCIGGLTVNSAEEIKGTRFVYTFERDEEMYSSMTLTQLSKHDRIILSDEDGNFGLAFGYIENIRPKFIVVSTDRRFINSQVRLPNFDAAKNQVFQTVLQSTTNQIDEFARSKKYRIDKDEMFHGLALARYNLLNLFMPDGDSKRRRLLVDLEKPKFDEKPIVQYRFDESKFNSDQLKAFDMALRCQDYSLILGMPGTGKTTVIANLIKCLVENSMSVLIASYTHSAVDNILEKLIEMIPEDELSLLRVGSPKSVSDKIKKYSIYDKNTIYPMTNKEDFKKALLETKVVATTCLGIKDIVFTSRQEQFDYCIIDEASQVSLPVVLGPLRFANKFILVGDHHQLPPLVLNPHARKGLSKSLFKLLSEKYPESVTDLTYQYRMCSEIQLISNTLIYNGRLKCGTTRVSEQKLIIPYPERFKEKSNNVPDSSNWMTRLLDEKTKVLFINHDSLSNAREVTNGDKIENPVEANLISQMIHCLSLTGIPTSSIGVMSFYRAQLRHFYKSLHMFPDLEILTADRFQGRDKPIIIISLVRSNDKNIAGELLREWRRINVAMTRAKCKLVVVGSSSLMSTIDEFKGFMELCYSNGWVQDLPNGADVAYGEMFMGFSQEWTSSINSSMSHDKKKVFKVGVDSKVVQRSVVLKNVLDDMEKGVV